ncbi:ATP-binding protein [Actinomadura oligospora]|uniref:ATP-binding protein n=1 Tax=Actinomadura oligospora TaxID=111804 RepID=UPI0004B7490E|nr:ATP-binding protein [Actinomadura oligospora]
MGTRWLGIDDDLTGDLDTDGDPPRPAPRPTPPATPAPDATDTVPTTATTATPDTNATTAGTADTADTADGAAAGAPPAPASDAAWTLAADPRTVARARTLTTGRLRDWARLGRIAADPAAIDDVVLIVDELITNAVVHGRGAVRLRLTLDGAPTAPVLLGEISDDDPARPALPRAASAPRGLDWSEDGRGLLLVTALATDYGTRPRPPGKTVWFTCDLSPRART